MARTGDIGGVRLLAPLLFALITLAAAPAFARQPPAAIVVDANTGATLHASAADAQRYPASLTKIMTVYLMFERLKDGRLKLSTPIRFSARAAGQAPSKLGLKAGETIKVEDAISALITKSANDVATAVAEHIAGNEIAFARLMTAKARQLGMTRTVFENASGLPNRNQVTTARDMARLALALQDNFPSRYRMFSQRQFVFRDRRYKNHNRLLGRFRGTDGIKTGYTRASGFNITTSVRRGRRHIVGVVMGQRSGPVRDAVMRSLLVKSLPKASPRRTRRAAPMLVARPRLLRQPRPIARPRLVAASPVARVPKLVAHRTRPPSTFGEQLQRMNGPRSSELPRNAILAPTRVAAPAAPSRATHQVQIGAFFSETEARGALLKAQQRAGALLRGFQPVSLKVASNPRPIYRARFAGFDSKGAREICSRLKTIRVDCFVTRSN